MTATVTNGPPKRKQLSDELDRLEAQMDRQDSILDALSEGLAGAVGEASRLAIKDAVIAILTDPALRRALHTASAPVTGPSFAERLKAAARNAAAVARTAAGAAVAAAATGVVAAVQTVRTLPRRVAGLARAAAAAWRWKKAAMIALGAGAVVAVLAANSHVAATALSGVTAAVAAAAVQAGLWARRVARTIGVA